MAINEDQFLTNLFKQLSWGPSVIVPPGDDCAALDLGGDDLILIAVDQIAADSHYYGPDAEEPTSPALAGRKLLARNLSDIAAMGGIPKYALAAVAMPIDANEDRLNEFAGGLIELAKEHCVELIGGDLGSAPSEVASLTIMGTAQRDKICLRKNAEPGQCIFVTGHLGHSLDFGHHLSFTPRIGQGRWLAENNWTRCMIDLSDGLLKDLTRIAKASDVGAELDRVAIPLNVARDLRAGLCDGEDYELCFTVDPDRAESLCDKWPFSMRLTCVGTVTEQAGQIVDLDGQDLNAEFGAQFDHFA